MSAAERCLAVLTEARAIFAQREWIQFRCAEDKNGKRVRAISLKARRSCLAGAILEAAVRVTGQRLTKQDADSIAGMLGFACRYDIARWNDQLYQSKARILAHVDNVLAHFSPAAGDMRLAA